MYFLLFFLVCIFLCVFSFFFFFFFFSSRRRHTRFDCDWSSDVCSSDLQLPHESIIYVADTARQPYGPKRIAEVRAHALEVMDHLVEHDVKMRSEERRVGKECRYRWSAYH